MLIKNPIITEKTVNLAQNFNRYTFEVTKAANKVSAAKELEQIFGVKVVSVSTKNRLGKIKRFGKTRRQETRLTDRKIMVFRLQEGNKIEAFTAK